MTKRTVGWVAGSLGWTGADALLSACPVCFRIEDGPTSAGIRAAVIVLLAATAVVLTGFAVFIARVVRRIRTQGGTETAPTA
jgi:hypothetical protein